MSDNPDDQAAATAGETVEAWRKQVRAAGGLCAYYGLPLADLPPHLIALYNIVHQPLILVHQPVTLLTR